MEREIFFYLFLSLFLLSDCVVYIIVFRSQDSLDYHLSHSLSSLTQNCSVLSTYHSLFSINYFSASLICQNEIDLTKRKSFNYIKYIEKSLPFEIAQDEQLHLSQQLLRPEIPNLYSENVCTITNDVLNSFSFDPFLVPLVDIYVLDSGINSDILSLHGPVIREYDIISPKWDDLHEHGTQVANLIRTVARNATLIDVQVVSKDGISTTHQIISGLDYIVRRFNDLVERRGPYHAAICMSLSGQNQSKVLRYLLYLLSKRIPLVGSAGNHQSYSCLTSPAESPHPIIVGGTSRENNLPLPSSNYGDCVDIYAPGESETDSFSGSSAGTAIVTGVLGILLQVMQLPITQFSSRFTTENSITYNELLLALQKYSLPTLSQVSSPLSLSLSTIIQIILDPSDHLLFIRNLMISTHHSLNFNRTKYVHFMSYTSCDYHDVNSLMRLAMEGVIHLINQYQLPKTFRRVKKNLSNYLKQQIEEYYQQNEKQ